jgi:hypothetical protein
MAEVSLFEGVQFPRRLPVKDGDEVLYFVNEEGAKQLVKKGLCRLMGTLKRARALEVIHRAEKPVAPIGALLGEALHCAAYSHNHEVSETYVGEDGRVKRRHWMDANVEKVWTLRHLDSSLAPIFRSPVLDCLSTT